MSTSEVTRRPVAPLDVTETKAAMTAYQAGLKSLLTKDDLQTFRDRQGNKHAFPKRSAMRKIALWCDLSLENRTQEVERDEPGKIVRARVVYRASAPNGRFADGEGVCDITERGFSKPEHDVLAVAATRACNRAIANLVGLGAVTAEELDGTGEPVLNPELPYGPPATEQLAREAAEAIQKQWPGYDGYRMVKFMTDTFGEFPEIAARTIKGLVWAMSNSGEFTTGSEKAPTPPMMQGEATTEASPPVPSGAVTEAEVVPEDDSPDEVDVDAMFDPPETELEK